MSHKIRFICVLSGILYPLCCAGDSGASSSASLERTGFISAGCYSENGQFKLVDQFGLENFGQMHNAEFYIGPAMAVIAVPDVHMPVELRLEQNFPNPFNQSTIFRFAVPKAGKISMELYSMLGQYVMTVFAGERPPGFYQILFNGSDDSNRPLPSGTYFCRLVTPDDIRIVKFSIIR
jgi:hypothetical protein